MDYSEPDDVKPRPVDHSRALLESTKLTRWNYEMWLPHARQVTPREVMGVLSAVGVQYVLIGTYGFNGWMMETFSTSDIDLLISPGDALRAVDSIAASYPDLHVQETDGRVRFFAQGLKSHVIDLQTRPDRLCSLTFDRSIAVDEWHVIADCELAIAMKFSACCSTSLHAIDRMQHACDFMSMVINNESRLNHADLHRLGEIAFPGGGQRIAYYIRQSLAREMLDL